MLLKTIMLPLSIYYNERLYLYIMLNSAGEGIIPYNTVTAANTTKQYNMLTPPNIPARPRRC